MANNSEQAIDYPSCMRGVADLRVADAAVFLDVPSVATNPTVVMLAKCVSQWLNS